MPAVVGGVLHGLQPHASAGSSAGEAGAVADRVDGGVSGSQVLVDDDPVVHDQAGRSGELVAWHDPYPQDCQFGAVLAAARADGRGHGSVASGECRQALAQPQVGTRVSVRPDEVVRHHRGQRPSHRPFCGLEHGDVDAALAGRRGELQADEARADHDDRSRRRERPPQVLGFGQRPQLVHTGEFAAGDGEWAGAGPGGEDECRVGQHLAVVEADGSMRAVDRDRLYAGTESDPVLCEEPLAAQG
jgi:hypothetical protein